MLDVVCWKWKPVGDYRSKFEACHVNTLRAMVERHYQAPHRFTCITDDPRGIDPRVRIIPLWDDHASLVSPHGRQSPSCYRRLRAFSAEAAELIGSRFVSLDLDVVIIADIRPLWDRPEDFVMWEGTAGANPYNGSMFLMTAGARRQVWETFDPKISPARARALQYVGSDQAHIAATLGKGEAKWTVADGVYSWRNHIRYRAGGAKLPKNARAVFFHGQNDPWTAYVQKRAPWIKEHYTI